MVKDILISRNWEGYIDVLSLRKYNKIQKNLFETIDYQAKTLNKNILMDY